MDTVVRDVKLALEVLPIFWQDTPHIRIEFNSKTLFDDRLDTEKTFEWTLPAQESNRFSVFMLNKSDADCQEGKDKAIIIKRVGLENFFYDSFLLASRYRPEYSAGYYDYARTHGITVEPEIQSNYLGFNGEWFLEFSWPTFTWIYLLETNNQGWIYEKNV